MLGSSTSSRRTGLTPGHLWRDGSSRPSLHAGVEPASLHPRAGLEPADIAAKEPPTVRNTGSRID